jgi:hypothetical protein
MRRKHKEDVIRKEKELAQKLGQNINNRMTHPEEYQKDESGEILEDTQRSLDMSY